MSYRKMKTALTSQLSSTTYGLTTACKRGIAGQRTQFALGILEEVLRDQKPGAVETARRIDSSPTARKIVWEHSGKEHFQDSKFQLFSTTHLAARTFGSQARIVFVEISDEFVLEILAASPAGDGASRGRFRHATGNVSVFLGHMVNHR